MLIRVLGPFEVEVAHGGPIDIGGPRQRAVLARLLSARGEVVSVDRLIEDLWRGEAPPRAIASLQAYVSHLRRLLEPSRERRAPARLLVSAAPGYAIRLPAEAVDAWSFERLLADARAAAASDPHRARRLAHASLQLWRGDAYAEFAGESWAQPEAVRLEELRLAARELLLDVTLRTGGAAEAAAEAEPLTRQYPLREEGWRLLALALWTMGRQADALAALRRARTLLAEELGLDPGRPLVDLESAILAQRVDLLPQQRPPTAAAPEPAMLPDMSGTEAPDRAARMAAAIGGNTHRAAGTAVPAGEDARRDTAGSSGEADREAGATRPGDSGAELFVGRDDELATLRVAAVERPRIVLLTGEAGVGKTSLLGRFRRELEDDGWLVLLGRCPEVEGAPPAWAWVEALRRLEEHAPPGELRPAIAPLLDDAGVAARPGEQDVAAGRFRLHRAVIAWLRAAAGGERPVAIVLDDLHAADVETLMLLGSVAELVEAGGPRVLLVAALRPADNRERLAGAMAELARRSPVRVHLDGLAAADVAWLVETFASTSVDPATVAALAERTGGNPFYVRESARLLASEGALVATSDVPEGVRDVLRRRLSRLPQPAVAVLRLAAVVGREADVETLVEAADADEGAVLDALEAGLIAGLLTEPAPGRVRFVHGLVRDTMYTDLSHLRRTRMHARVAACTRRRRPDDYPALAYHYARAASSDTAGLAVEYAIRAAELAERRYAYDAAAELLEGALATADAVPGDRDALLVNLLGRLLRAQASAGAVAAARATRARAVDVAVASGREELLVAAFTAWTVATPWQIREYEIRDDRIVDLLTRLLRRGDLAAADRCRLLDALTSELDGDADPRGELAGRDALELARGLGDPALLALGLAARLRTMRYDRDVESRAVLGAELREVAQEHGLVSYLWVAEQVLGNCAAAGNRPQELSQSIARQRAIARTYRLAEPLAINAAAHGVLAHVAGDFAAAQGHYDEVWDQLRRTGSFHADGFHFLATATLMISQGRMAELVEPTRVMLERLGPRAADAHALALATAGRLREAAAVPIGTYPIRPDYFEIGFYTVRALAVCALGRADLAPAVLDALRPVRDQLAAVSSTSIVMRPVALTLGELYALLGRAGEAAEHYRLAVEVATRWGAPHWLAEARAALAGV
ncbi:BTAD domain-containing putative transcriptional regulator [Dactylosporangium sp. NPDC051484]|uniref:ATP-binding protein n=1 Tax=Dactylosporangium sp. NPDC051484 TaxID=3154942 RepID=UPI00344B271E